MASVLLLATLDTKGHEAALGTPTVAADVSRHDVFALAGTSLDLVQATADRGQAVTMAGLITFPAPMPDTSDKPLVAATMFGVTTACVEHARGLLAEAGYEVLVFHATGTGGHAMEALIADGVIAGVLDITTTELADEEVGGVLSAGPDRLTAAGRAGVPQVVSTGALDMVNVLGPPSAGQPFDDPEARRVLHDAIRSGMKGDSVEELDLHINDPGFAAAAARQLLALMKERPTGHQRSGAGGRP